MLQHQKMQKRSRKLQRLQDKNRNYFKDVKKRCERSEKKLIKREARFLALSDKSGNCRMAADDLEEEVKDLQAGEGRRGSCASQSNGCCFDPAMVEQISTFGAAHARPHIQALFEVPATPVHMGREEKGAEWEEEQAQRMASQQMGPQVSGGRNEGVTAGPALDPVRQKDANGESGGGGDLNMSGNGSPNRGGSRLPRGRRNHMQEGENP